MSTTPKTKSSAPTRSSVRGAPRSRPAAAKPVASHAVATRSSSSSPAKPTSAQQLLAKVKSKTGLAIAAGVVLAGVGGLAAYRYRAAR